MSHYNRNTNAHRAFLLLTSIPFLFAAAQAKAKSRRQWGRRFSLMVNALTTNGGDAKTLASNQGHSIRIKRSDRYLFMCVTYPEDSRGVIDGYLVSEKQPTPLHFHVSAKVGDREWQDNEWSEREWWAAEGWGVVPLDTIPSEKGSSDS